MKKRFAMLCALLLICPAVFVFAEEGTGSAPVTAEASGKLYATIGDAMASEGYTGIVCGDQEHFVVVVELDGTYLRVVADISVDTEPRGVRLEEALDDAA